MAATYLDSSAIVKLAIAEPESDALRRYLERRRPLVSSALARTEVMRALFSEGEAALERGRAVLASLEMVRVNNRVLDAAGSLAPAHLRSLDAIHIATAQRLGADLGCLVAYDERLLHAAHQAGIATAAPR